MTTINNQEQTTTASLGKALQEARLSAALTVADVAEKLNLAVSTVRDIEDSLDNVVETKKYPAIYLRGYIANYAKLVALDNLNQFLEYQQLSVGQKHPGNLRSPLIIRPVKKRAKRLSLLFILIVAVALSFLIVQQVFFSAGKAVKQETELSKTGVFSAPDVSTDQAIVDATADVGAATANATILSVEPQTDSAAVVQEITEKSSAAAEEIANLLTAEQPSEAVIFKTSDSAQKTEGLAKKQVDAQPRLLEKEQANAAALDSLQLSFSADCWTEIFDATGKRLAFALYKKGYLLTISGVAPFQLKLGDSSAVTIQYQDKVFEPEFAAGRTVRFSIPR